MSDRKAESKIEMMKTVNRKKCSKWFRLAICLMAAAVCISCQFSFVWAENSGNAPDGSAGTADDAAQTQTESGTSQITLEVTDAKAGSVKLKWSRF